MTITLDLAPEAEARLQQVAAKHGQDANEFVTGLLEPQITYLCRSRQSLRLGWPT